jgi:hypothetical protein
MAAPNPPNIYVRPLCSNASLTFYWDAPTSGTAPTSYNLTVSGPGGGTCNVLSPGYYTVTGLTNGSNYSSYIRSSNANGESALSSFRDVVPGFKAGWPESIYDIVTGSNVRFTWQAPAATPVAPIKWYVITDTLTNNRYNTTGNTFDVTIPNVIAGTHYFTFQSVNDPGYSARISTNAITIESPISFNWVTNKYEVLSQTSVRSSNNIDWDAYATSDTTIQSNFEIFVTPDQKTIQSMLGMSYSSNPSFPVYNNMPHCVYTAANGSLYLFDNGSFGPSLGTYKQNDIISMTFSGNNVTYKKNGASIYTKTYTPGSNLHLCCTAGLSNAVYKNIKFINVL